MKRLSQIASVLCFPVLLFAQHPNMDNYKPARSNGPLPKDFLTSTAEKYEQDIQKISTDDQKEQKAEQQFYLQNNYSIDQLRFSGTVLVNDTLGMYVNRVADSLLLKQDPELRKKITFYVLRSSAVNAFTTDQGVIFVTVGLLTRLQNEAELAYVLAHEIIHFKRHHVLQGYQEGVKAQNGIGKYEETTFENRYLKRHRYARSQESQADEEGFELLVNSNYDPHAAIAAFDILALADAPFSDTSFSKNFFETYYLLFPSRFQVDTVKAIKPQDEDEDDDLATHPSVYKRRKAIVKKFSKLDPKDTTGVYFLVSSEMFYKIKEMARFEECDEHISDGEWTQSIYADYVDQKSYPDNHYLTREMVRALYAEVIEKNRAYDFSDLAALFQAWFSMSAEDDKVIGEQGRLTAFVNKTDATGWNVMVLDYAWQAHLKYPDDKDIYTWCQGIARELAVKNDIRFKDFAKTDSLFIALGDNAKKDTALAKKIKTDTPTERYRVALDHMDKDSIQHFHYWQFAFLNEMKDSGFVQLYRWASNYADSLVIADSLYDEKSGRAQSKLDKEREERFTAPQGISKIIAVNPIFVAYSDKDENSDVDVMKSLEGKADLLKEMQSSADKCGMQIEFLDGNGLDSTSVGKLNDLLVASEWFEQRDQYGDNQILPYPMEDMHAIAQKYGTNYFMWSAYYTYRQKRGGYVVRALELVALPLLPHTVYRLITPREDVYYYSIVYDVSTGKPVFVQKTQMTNQKATKDRMKLHVFDLIRQLSKPKKEDKK